MRAFISFIIAVPLSFLISFFLTHSMPGHFLDDESQVTLTNTEYFQKNLFITFFDYLSGDWGRSWVNPDQNVLDLIQQAFLFTFSFQIVALLIVIFLSIAASYFMIVSRSFQSFFSHFLFLGSTLPLLFLLPVLIYLFSFYFDWLPLRYDNSLLSYFLPLVGLIFRPFCFSTQILFSKWTETTAQAYFRTARSKGLNFSQSLWRHGFKNSALVYVTQIVQLAGQILTGSVLIETLFSLPGLGFLFVETLKNRDLPLLTGLIFIFCCLYLITQILLDWAYQYFEPRRQN